MAWQRRDRVRYFTPAEANEALVAIVPQLEEATRLVNEHDELAHMLANGAAETPEEHEQMVTHTNELRARATAILAAIDRLGVEVKGLDEGLLDFPALYQGREVFLCWKRGEDKVQWWHPVHTGVAGRRHVGEGDPGDWEWCN